MFDEQYVVDFIIKAIKKGFNTKDWKDSFGGKSIKVTDDDYGEETMFPVIRIEIVDNHQTEKTYDSSQLIRYSTFWFEIEHFNQAVEKNGTNKVTLGRKINAKIMEILQEELNPHITRNSRIESPDPTIYRRLIEGYCKIDNNTKTFYR